MSRLVLRGGMLVDGTGTAARPADVLLDGPRIAAIGDVGTPADAEVLDVDGLIVAPGFIDHHVHYDAQVMWDPALTPTCFHGVTTVIGGNCGFGVAPLGPGAADYVIRLLAAVEGMQVEALRAGTTWDWTGFGEWLELVDRTTVLNAAFFAGHSTIRRLVMGDTAATSVATAEQVRQMAAVLGEALAAGAVGLSTSLNENHLDGDGNPVPSRAADRRELMTLAGVLAGRPGTLLELVPPMAGPFGPVELDLLSELSLRARAPVVWNSLAVDETRPRFHESMLAASPYAAARGARVVAMTIPDVSRLRLSFSNGMILQAFPGWSEVFALGPADRLAALADPGVRARLRNGLQSCSTDGLFGRFSDVAAMRLSDIRLPTNRHLEGQRLGDAAARAGCDSLDFLLDVIGMEGLEVGLWPPSPGDDDASWRRRAQLWADGDVVVGGGDAGAHLDAIDSFNYPAVLCGPVVRDRGLLSLEEAVRLLTSVPARLFGLADRGVLATGACADIVVFDRDRIGPGPVELRGDLPGGGRRLYATAGGIRYLLVNGTVVVDGGELTGRSPGRVLRQASRTL